MIDYSKYQSTPAIPEASSMIETFRAIGYSIETAVADIIDNSIPAGAKSIWISFNWLGAETRIAIKDDGIGMDNEELIQALRPGSKNPLESRSKKDLGRFGLGLKTASFSQCRQLTVISKKKEGIPSFWTWDLDFVNQTGRWELIQYIPDVAFEDGINELKSGTTVIWNDIDRLVKGFKMDSAKDLDKFLIIMERVKRHISMVFHRFIESGKLNIYFQDRKIDAWDPYLRDETSTQPFPPEPLFGGKITVKGYVLPHKSRITEARFRLGEGPKGWNEQQGFYIYRNERLLLAGDWLGMFRKEEHYKLARIQIDLPNDMDADWQIDIKKSVARPPHGLFEQLKAYAGTVRAQAVEVYRHRGKNIKPAPWQKFVPLWTDYKRGDKWFYRVNRNHPLIEEIKRQAILKPEKSIDALIRLIEETIPTKSIYIKEAEEPETQGKPFEGIKSEEVFGLMKQVYNSFLSQGKTEAEAKSAINNLEPFNYFPELVTNL